MVKGPRLSLAAATCLTLIRAVDCTPRRLHQPAPPRRLHCYRESLHAIDRAIVVFTQLHIHPSRCIRSPYWPAGSGGS
ncbi:hypothetical protein IG631_19273 [Alternaria alternata]|nr:hypothetical protein IG631_19273 [Alternaria alternata]